MLPLSFTCKILSVRYFGLFVIFQKNELDLLKTTKQ